MSPLIHARSVSLRGKNRWTPSNQHRSTAWTKHRTTQFSLCPETGNTVHPNTVHHRLFIHVLFIGVLFISILFTHRQSTLFIRRRSTLFAPPPVDRHCSSRVDQHCSSRVGWHCSSWHFLQWHCSSEHFSSEHCSSRHCLLIDHGFYPLLAMLYKCFNIYLLLYRVYLECLQIQVRSREIWWFWSLLSVELHICIKCLAMDGDFPTVRLSPYFIQDRA